MKLRVLALVALTGALVPVWASEVITHDMRINRQRITTVLNAPGGVQVPPPTKDICINRQRITNIYGIPGMVRDAMPNDPQINRSRIDATPRPRPYTGPRIDLPVPTPGRGAPPAKSNPPAKAPDKEEVGFQVPGKAAQAPPKPAVVDRAKSVAERVTVVDWRAGKQFKDDKGRVWCLILGQPEAIQPAALDGWVMQAAESPILFFSKTGRMWRMITMPLP